jgi:ribosomal protein S18 acetylase RimI-like enzyme
MINIRLTNHDDIDNIAKIHCQSWEQAYQNLLPKTYIDANNNLADKAAMWAQVIPQVNTTTLIAYDEIKRDVGFISYYQKDKQVEFAITTLYILPQNQGKGVGTALMAAALQKMRQINPVALVSLWVLKNNLAAIRFYQRQGFTVSDEQEVEIFDLTEIIDIKMIKDLS